MKPTVYLSESFIKKPRPRRSELKRELHKLILAASDIDASCSACGRLLSLVPSQGSSFGGEYAGMDQPLYRSLVAAVVISYARPFTDNNGYGVLTKKWCRFDHSKRQQAHDIIMKARHELFAHSDVNARSLKIVPPGVVSQTFPTTPTKTLAYAVKSYSFPLFQVRIFQRHTSELVKALQADVEALLNQLYEGMELPKAPFDLRLTDGL